MTRAATARREEMVGAARSRPLPASYLQRSMMPLACLVFLLPFVVLYEVGTRQFAFDPAQQVEQRIIAFTLMQRFFELFGANGRYLPAMAVAGILLSWHIARNDPWKLSAGTLAGMLLEGIAWGVPLLAIGTVSARYFGHHSPLAAGTAQNGASGALLVLSIGAGVYEELVFRLIGLTVLSVVLVDVLKLPKLWAYLGMVVTSAVAFALYHYLGYEVFTWRSFVFRTLAGMYFGVLFLARGFGVSACAHTSYDVIVVLLRFCAPM